MLHHITALICVAILPSTVAAAPKPSPPGQYTARYSGKDADAVQVVLTNGSGVRIDKLIYRIGDRLTIRGVSKAKIKGRELIVSGRIKHFVKQKDKIKRIFSKGDFVEVPIGDSPLPTEAQPYVDFGPFLILRRYRAGNLMFTVARDQQGWTLEEILAGLSFVASRSGELDLAPTQFFVKDRLFWRDGPVTEADKARCRDEITRQCTGKDQCEVLGEPECKPGIRPTMQIELSITIERPGVL